MAQTSSRSTTSSGIYAPGPHDSTDHSHRQTPGAQFQTTPLPEDSTRDSQESPMWPALARGHMPEMGQATRTALRSSAGGLWQGSNGYWGCQDPSRMREAFGGCPSAPSAGGSPASEAAFSHVRGCAPNCAQSVLVSLGTGVYGLAGSAGCNDLIQGQIIDKRMAGRQGFEPRYADPESILRPLYSIAPRCNMVKTPVFVRS